MNNNTSNKSFNDTNSAAVSDQSFSTHSPIHQPKLYKKTSSSQVSLRQYSIVQSDTEIADDLIIPTYSHNDSDVEIFTDSKLVTDDELDGDESYKIDDCISSNVNPLTPSTSGLSGKDPTSVLNVKFVDYYFDNSAEESEFAKEILTIIKLLKIKKWHTENLKPEFLSIIKISGAMTNAIYQLKYKETAPLPSLLLRVYGPNVDSIIDRDYELQVLARLSNLKIGPKLFGCFNNGRFEEFLENSVTLTKDNVREDSNSLKISKRMRELHFFVPLTKGEKREESITWKRVDNWMQTISKIDSRVLKYVTQFESFADFSKVVEKYRKYLSDSLVNKSPSFTHCDTQYGNLLKVANEIVVIDFEYSGPNPPAVDIANHFSEWMHDYHSTKPELLQPSKYPSKKEIELFLKGYNFSDTCSLYDDIIKSRALVNLHWVLWGILQSGALNFNESDFKTFEIHNDNELNNAVHGAGSGADIDTFDFLLYSREKFKIVLGDWLQLNILGHENGDSFKSYKLDVDFYSATK